MLLRIINLKALGQRFQVRNPRWRLLRRARIRDVARGEPREPRLPLPPFVNREV